MATLVGIDLGTTNSAVAHRNAYGRPEVIASRDGQNITPSVVYFGSDPPAVGQEAKEWARLGNEEIASFFKPHMGNSLFQLQFNGKSYSATELSTLVLRRLKEDAEARLGDSIDRASSSRFVPFNRHEALLSPNETVPGFGVRFRTVAPPSRASPCRIMPPLRQLATRPARA